MGIAKRSEMRTASYTDRYAQAWYDIGTSFTKL
jgi:hypothetical protein